MRLQRVHRLLNLPAAHFVYLAVLVAAALAAVEEEEEPEFSNTWAVHFKEKQKDKYSQDGAAVDALASKYGFANKGEIIPGSGIYEFVHPRVKKRSLSQHDFGHDCKVSEHPDINFAEQQVYQEAEVKRMRVNDQLWNETWHLNPLASTWPGMNIQAAWEAGITGKGVNVVHIDSGLDYLHRDIMDNYRSQLSYDIADEDRDPYPPRGSSHGTNMAGLVAAKANNSVCSVGVAHNCNVGMIKFSNEERKARFTDAQEAKAYSVRSDQADVLVLGYGPNDIGSVVRGMGPLAKRALERNIRVGRGGKGTLFVLPPGNGGVYQDSCATQGSLQSIYTIATNAAGEHGSVPVYVENCTAVLASAHSSGRYRAGAEPERYMVTTEPGNGCTRYFTGTSSSAAVTGGVMALILEANPALTWRDVQHLLVRGVRPFGTLDTAANWITNGAGRRYSRTFGYGLMDAGKLVRLARAWTTAPKQFVCDTRRGRRILTKEQRKLRYKTIRSGGTYTDSQTVRSRSCQIRHLEHVQLTLSLHGGRRGDLELYLRSPMGTRDQLMHIRPFDFSPSGFKDWTILSVGLWGERALGTWELEVRNVGHPLDGDRVRPMVLRDWSLTLYGTKVKPEE